MLLSRFLAVVSQERNRHNIYPSLIMSAHHCSVRVELPGQNLTQRNTLMREILGLMLQMSENLLR